MRRVPPLSFFKDGIRKIDFHPGAEDGVVGVRSELDDCLRVGCFGTGGVSDGMTTDYCRGLSKVVASDEGSTGLRNDQRGLLASDGDEGESK